MSYKILMIEDDPVLAEMLCDYLALYNMVVENFEDPYTGLSALEVGQYDLLLLDLSLPGMDGLEVLQKVRDKHTLPIIISSARSDLDDKVTGLQLGADDYLAKPYEPKELYARIQSNIRRCLQPQESGAPSSDFVLDTDAMEIRFQGVALELTRAEFEIFSCLIKRHSCAVSREELISSAPSLREGNPKSLEVLVGRIRQKIGEDRKHPNYLKVVRGVGYKLVG